MIGGKLMLLPPPTLLSARRLASRVRQGAAALGRFPIAIRKRNELCASAAAAAAARRQVRCYRRSVSV